MGVLKRQASCAIGGPFAARRRAQSAPSASAVPPVARFPYDAKPSTAEEVACDPRDISSGSAAASGSNGGLRFGSIDSYELHKEIGKGAFGSVSKARHLETGEFVAIKSVLEGGDDEALLREAGLLALCSGNPAVVELREVARCRESSKLYLVMEFVGPSLLDYLRYRSLRGQALSESETRRVMKQLLGGVEMMHAQGAVHRDLKPGNVLLGENGRVKICDLGLGMAVTKPPPHTQLAGTVGYLAPEQLLGEMEYGAPVDLWSLGCVMGELVAGEPLFQESNEYQQVCLIADKLGVPDDVSGLPFDFTKPSQLRGMVPEERLSQAGFDVLRGLLGYDAKNRLTAAEALQMPWFAMEVAPEEA